MELFKRKTGSVSLPIYDGCAPQGNLDDGEGFLIQGIEPVFTILGLNLVALHPSGAIVALWV